MLQGKVVCLSGGYSVEFTNGESFKVPEEDLPGLLKSNGSEVGISISPIGESADQGQAIEMLNYLLQIN